MTTTRRYDTSIFTSAHRPAEPKDPARAAENEAADIRGVEALGNLRRWAIISRAVGCCTVVAVQAV